MAYAILRTKKLKAPGNVAASASHIERTRPTHNADLSISNEWLIGGPGMYASAKKVWDSIPKKRSDAVHAFEVLLTASPEAFDHLDLDAWKAKNIEWLKTQFKGCEIVGASLHLDESTPHIQAIIVPTERSKDGTLKLNCKKHLGGAAKLSSMQTSYGKAMSGFGLERGLEGSGAKHTTIAQFYGAMRAGSGVKFAPVAIETPPMLLTEKARAAWAEAQKKATIEAWKPSVDELRMKERQNNDLKRSNAQLKHANSNLSQANSELRIDAAESQRLAKEAAAQLRALPLEQVAQALGCFQSKKLLEKDKKMWESAAGKISIKGTKFVNRETGKGGGGAFDLVMHVNDCTYSEALAFLRDVFDPAEAVRAAMEAARIHALAQIKKAAPAVFQAPTNEEARWPRVRQYLTEVRALAGSLVDKLKDQGWIGADFRNNAFFLKVLGNRTTAAELRGTGQSHFKGSRGRSSEGVFPVLQGKARLAVCESAIDAISYVQLHPDSSAIATGGTGKWQAAIPFIEQHGDKYGEIVCASDNGVGGAGMAKAMGLRHDAPPEGFGDWNDVAQAVALNPSVSSLWQGQVEAQIKEPEPTSKAQPRQSRDEDVTLG